LCCGRLFKQGIRGLASRAKNAGHPSRLLTIAAVLDGSSREDAAKVGGMDRQTLRDRILRFNEQGPKGLINKCAPGAPGKLRKKHKAFLACLVEEGPIPAIHGVVRWRACDLITRLHEEFDISVSDDTVYARPKA
jgi:transposase